MADFELIREKDYELLEEISYSVEGNFKKTNNVILKAPTLLNAKKFESALEDSHAELIKFICDNNLMLAPDSTPIQFGSAQSLHVFAMVKLSVDYRKFFFDLASLLAQMQKSN